MKAVTLIVFSILLVALISASVLADDYREIDASKRNNFNARLSHINCKIQLTEKQLDLLSPINSSITSYKSALDTDYAKLQEFATALNNKDFSDYMTKTFKNNLKTAMKAIQDTKKDVKSANITKEQKTTLREAHKTAISEYADCVNKADKEIADTKGDHLNKWLKHWKNIIDKMKSKGYDTTEMESVVSDAENKLIPAIEAIKTTAKENKRTAMQDARNLHLHLWARFEVARLRSYLNSIDDDAIAQGYSAEVSTINSKLTAVSNLAVPGKSYGPGEFESVWKSIKEAAQLLKDLNKKLK